MVSNEPLLPLRPIHDRDGLKAGSSLPKSKSTTFSTPRGCRRGLESLTNSWSFGLQRILSRCGFNTLQTATDSNQISYHLTSGRRLPQTRAFRFCILLLATPLALLTCSVMWRSGIPHSFADISRSERELPQHRWEVHVDPTTGELVENGCHGKRVKWEETAGDGYLRLPDQLWGHGFSNGLEEVLLAAHLAHLSNRSYVFEDYFKSRSPFPYTLDGLALRPSRIPLNAVVSGFIAGGNVSSDVITSQPWHLSISAEYYEYICPSSLSAQHRVVLSANDAPTFSDAASQIQWWVDRIKTSGKGKRCVEIVEGNASEQKGKRIFSHEYLKPEQHAQLFVQQLLNSPVIKHFSWSRLVEKSAERVVDALNLSYHQTSSPLHSIEALPGLLVIDLRRDPNARHCGRPTSGHAKTTIRRRVPRRKRGSRRTALQVEEEERDDTRLERRWWYWAGRAGQRLTSADVGANTAAASSSAAVTKVPSTRARYAGGLTIPHQTSSSSHPSTQVYDDERSKEKSGGVRIQKEDFDFGRGRGRVKWESHSEEVFAVPIEEQESPSESNVKEMPVEVGKPIVNFSPPKRKWMWWGSGSRRMSTSKALATTSVYQDEEVFATRTDDDSERELELRSLDDDAEDERRSMAIGRGHCRQPSIDQVFRRARGIRADWTHPVNRVIILSDGCPSFVLQLSSALANDGWEVVDPDAHIRRSIALNDRNHVEGVSIAVDMTLAEKAVVFLGNKHSTLSANVNSRRMAMGGSDQASWLL